MKKNHIITGIIAIIMLGLFACHPHNRIDGNGNMTTETRSIPAFTELRNEGSFDVHIVPDTINQVFVEAESNLMPYIYTKVSGNRLNISTRSHYNLDPSFPVTITVRTTYVDHIVLEGSGNILSDSLNVNQLELDLEGSGEIDVETHANYIDAKIEGSGKIWLYGQCNESDFRITGSGDIKSYGLQQDTSFCAITGSGDIYVWTTDFLSVNITGSGDVHYKGNPVVNSHITGSGSVIQE